MNRLIGIKGFIETSFVDWPGKICAVLFLGGCNFRCPFCHNHRLVVDPEKLADVPWETIRRRLERLQDWVDGVCISGGEPTLHPFVYPLAAEIRSLGFLVKLDTNGSRPEVLRRLVAQGAVDAVALDLKAPLRPESYARCAGRPVAVGKVLESLRILGEASVEVEVRTTVVPGLVEEEDVLEIARSIPSGLPYRVQGFRPQEAMDPLLRQVPPQPEDALERIRQRISRFRCAPPSAGRCHGLRDREASPGRTWRAIHDGPAILPR